MYYDLLLKYKDKYKVKIYGYNLDIDNHAHMVVSIKKQTLFSDFMKVVNSCFAKAYNKKVKRRGQVVMDRFQSKAIESNTALMITLRYVDLNSMKAGKYKHPKEGKFSSYHHYTAGKPDSLIEHPSVYENQGKTDRTRRKKYIEFVELGIKYGSDMPEANRYFIGNPDWTKKQYERVKKIRRDYYRDWKKRHKLKFG